MKGPILTDPEVEQVTQNVKNANAANSNYVTQMKQTDLLERLPYRYIEYNWLRAQSSEE